MNKLFRVSSFVIVMLFLNIFMLVAIEKDSAFIERHLEFNGTSMKFKYDFHYKEKKGFLIQKYEDNVDKNTSFVLNSISLVNMNRDTIVLYQPISENKLIESNEFTFDLESLLTNKIDELKIINPMIDNVQHLYKILIFILENPQCYVKTKATKINPLTNNKVNELRDEYRKQKYDLSNIKNKIINFIESDVKNIKDINDQVITLFMIGRYIENKNFKQHLRKKFLSLSNRDQISMLLTYYDNDKYVFKKDSEKFISNITTAVDMQKKDIIKILIGLKNDSFNSPLESENYANFICSLDPTYTKSDFKIIQNISKDMYLIRPIYYAKQRDQLYCAIFPNSKLIDNTVGFALLKEDGIYQYKTVLGSKKTIKKFKVIRYDITK